MKDTASNIALVVFSLTIALGAGEWMFRKAAWNEFYNELEKWDHPLYEIQADSPLEFTLRKNSSRSNKLKNSGRKWSYHINASGFRGDDIKPNDNETIAFLGDSYIFGYAVDQNQTLTEHLKRTYTSQGKAVPNLINYGVPGYNTVHEYHLLKKILSEEQPDLVVLGFVINDIEPQANVLQRPDVVYKYNLMWHFTHLKRSINKYFFNDEHVLPIELNTMEPYLEAFNRKSGKYRDAKKAFKNISKLCKENDIPLLIIIFPGFATSFDEPYEYQLIHDEVMNWSLENGDHAIDLYENFKNLDHTDFIVREDGHPNGKAFKKIAGIIRPLIDELLDN